MLIDNFDDAVLELRTNYDYANYVREWAKDVYDTESWYYSGATRIEEIFFTIEVVIGSILTCLLSLLGPEPFADGTDWTVTWIFDNLPSAEAEALTWEKIVNVWLLAPLDGQQWTIGMIDYMRKVIWDKPYNFPLIPTEVGG